MVLLEDGLDESPGEIMYIEHHMVLMKLKWFDF